LLLSHDGNELMELWMVVQKVRHLTKL
jgi:hypothetical protein